MFVRHETERRQYLDQSNRFCNIHIHFVVVSGKKEP